MGHYSKGARKDGSNGAIRGAIYKAVEKSVILYGSERWVVTGDMPKVLTAFHHWVAQQITEMTEKYGASGEW